MESPDFRPLLLAYAFDDGPIRLVDFTKDEDYPAEFIDALNRRDVLKLAWNCAFEREVIHQELGYSPPEDWLDVMHIAAVCGLPMSLAGASAALGLPEDKAKMKEGSALIRWFCVPTKDGYFRDPAKYPDKWSTFRDYCVRDVEAVGTIYDLLKRWSPNETERRFWGLDQRINERRPGARSQRDRVRRSLQSGSY